MTDYIVQLWDAIGTSGTSLQFNGFELTAETDMHTGAISWHWSGDFFYATPYWEDIEGIAVEHYDDDGMVYHETVPFTLTNDLKEDVANYFIMMQEYLDNNVGRI